MTRTYNRRPLLEKRRKARQRARLVRDIANDGFALAALVIVGLGLMSLAVGFGLDSVL